MHTIVFTTLLLLSVSPSIVFATSPSPQHPFSPDNDAQAEWSTFNQPIQKVAVIGAGPAGLQSASALIREGFDVRLFERSDAPGGNWYHNTLTPIRESYPNDALQTAAYVPDPRNRSVEYYSEGQDGLSLEHRWREHVRPSPIWDDLEANSSPAFTTLPDIEYPKDAPWALPAYLIQRHVRSFASTHGLNVNDVPLNTSAPPVTSYATRVEQLEKVGNEWKLSLRRSTRLPESKQIKTEWWTERFDAVVVAAGAYHAAHIPDIRGLVEWSQVERDGHFPVIHSQHYRNPEQYNGKTVLIIGASVSASEISRRIGPQAKKLYISLRNTTRSTYMARRSIRRLYAEAEIIPEVVEFGPIQPSKGEISTGRLRLLNGTWLDGVDEVILATGFRRSLPFLKDYFEEGGRASPDLPRSPILTNGHSLNSLSWTGHYIPDPTLAFTTVRPWTLGRYQSLAFAKVWKGTARLPSKAKLWEDYFNDNHWQEPAPVVFGTIEEETLGRQYVAWLNQQSLIYGGRLVDQWPIENRERFAYYADQAWEQGYVSGQNFSVVEDTARSKWPTYPRKDGSVEYELESLSEW